MQLMGKDNSRKNSTQLLSHDGAYARPQTSLLPSTVGVFPIQFACRIMNESARCNCTESLSSLRPPILQTLPAHLCNIPLYGQARVEQQKHGFDSALKSTHAKIFLSDQPLLRSGQGLGDNRCRISCDSKGVWNVSVLLPSVSEYCVTAMNLERQESFDHRDWDSFRNTFPTILSGHYYAHTPFSPSPAYMPSLYCPTKFDCFCTLTVSIKYFLYIKALPYVQGLNLPSAQLLWSIQISPNKLIWVIQDSGILSHRLHWTWYMKNCWFLHRLRGGFSSKRAQYGFRMLVPSHSC